MLQIAKIKRSLTWIASTIGSAEVTSSGTALVKPDDWQFIGSQLEEIQRFIAEIETLLQQEAE